MLTYLTIAKNRIKRLPVSIAELAKLNDFEFEGNPFEFPHKKVFPSMPPHTSRSSDRRRFSWEERRTERERGTPLPPCPSHIGIRPFLWGCDHM